MARTAPSDKRANTKLRVGVGGFVLRYPYRGVGRYARRLVAQFSQAEDIEPIVLLADEIDRVGVPVDAAHAEGDFASCCRTPQAVIAPQPLRDWSKRVLGRYHEGGQRIYWEQVGLRLAARRVHADVLYVPYHGLPFLPPRRSVVTVHDLIPLTVPGYEGPRYVQAFFSLACAAARQAAAVITDSEHARREIERLLHIPAARIHVVPLGVEPTFSPIADPVASARARERYDLPDHYLFYIGGSDVRKNIGILLRAVALLRDNASDDATLPPLVIVANAADAGSTPWHPDWRAQGRELGLGPEVRWVDRIAEEDLPAVYRGATAFLFPSRAEGFGLPPLEAMACGAPVLCADGSSLPEVVGEAGILLPPGDPGAWAGALLRICTDAELRGRLRAAGPKRAAQFTWERTGRGVLAVIRGVAGYR